jgi:hypothetical protein
MKLFLAILLPTMFLLDRAQTPTAEREIPQPYTLAEAYEVYSAVLPDSWNKSESTKLVIAQETTNFDMCLKEENLKPSSEELSVPAVADYLKVNQHSWILQWNIQIATPYLLVPRADILDLFQTKGVDGWEKFHKQYPQSSGWVELSAVGFDTEKKNAAVYVGHHCGWLCGGGGVKLLEKKADKWEVVGGTGCLWAS